MCTVKIPGGTSLATIPDKIQGNFFDKSSMWKFQVCMSTCSSVYQSVRILSTGLSESQSGVDLEYEYDKSVQYENSSET